MRRVLRNARALKGETGRPVQGWLPRKAPVEPSLEPFLPGAKKEKRRNGCRTIADYRPSLSGR